MIRSIFLACSLTNQQHLRGPNHRHIDITETRLLTVTAPGTSSCSAYGLANSDPFHPFVSFFIQVDVQRFTLSCLFACSNLSRLQSLGTGVCPPYQCAHHLGTHLPNMYMINCPRMNDDGTTRKQGAKRKLPGNRTLLQKVFSSLTAYSRELGD